jgi:hypothetical protein
LLASEALTQRPYHGLRQALAGYRHKLPRKPISLVVFNAECHV